jgi:fructosamine-3-kinase
VSRDVRTLVAAALGGSARVTGARPLGGGDINEAFEVKLADGRALFVKTNARPPAGMFPAEARGLRWLTEARALRIPEVIAATEDVLVLELLRPAARRTGFDETLGRGLAALHRAGAASFGLDHDNFIGRLPQANAPRPTWSEFFRAQRLEAQLRTAADRGLITSTLRRDFDALFSRLDALVGADEPPARLHGDLWGGNLHVDDRGEPCLIDPAVYGGHREIDLAMMKLFGGFSGRVFAAYDEAYPLSPGADDRVALYQLYPLLVHVNLFGGSYLGSVQRTLSALL